MTCIAGSHECIGNVALADREVAFNQQINAITPREGIDPFFLYTLILTSKRLIQLSSSEAMKGMVSKSRFESIRVINVPCEHQTEFGFLFKKLVSLSEKLDQSAKASDHLCHSLAEQASEENSDHMPIEYKQRLAPFSAQRLEASAPSWAIHP